MYPSLNDVWVATSKSRYNYPVEPLDLAIELCMIHGYCQVFQTQVRAEGTKRITGKSELFVS